MRWFFQLMKLLTVVSTTLSIVPGTGSAVAQSTLKTGNFESPEKGGPRRWQLLGGSVRMYVAPSPDSQVVNVVEEAVILSNLGCSRTRGQLWCKVRSFRGGVQGYIQSDRLQPAVGPDGVVAMGVNDTKRRARNRNFDVNHEIRCAQEQGQALGQCDAAAARSDGADATVVVTFPNGFSRSLYFVHGEFVRASATMSGVGTDFDWALRDGLHYVRVDDQRYEVPEALVVNKQSAREPD